MITTSFKAWRFARRHRVFRRCIALLVTPWLLAGCADRITQPSVSSALEKAIPDNQIADLRTTSCETLWELESKESNENPLYWLRAMDCADRLNSRQARLMGQSLTADSWENTFKQSILLASAEPTLTERRQLLSNVTRYRDTMPGSLRPLVQLWRERQNLEVALNDERLRTQRIQDNYAVQLSITQQAQAYLANQLVDTQKKLENLTDIERRLSSRKQLQGDIANHDDKTPANNAAKSGDSEKKYPIPGESSPAVKP